MRPNMTSRITLLLITLFWVTMNYLLWRSEYVGSEQGSRVPVEAIWQKILTAPNGSGLGIDHHNRQIGHGNWSPNIGQGADVRKLVTEDVPPDGMIEGPTGYRLDFTGSVSLDDIPGRLNFDFDLKLNTNEDWQEFNLKLKLHNTSSWEIHSRASEQTVHFRMQDEGESFERVFKFADLENPQTLAQALDLPVPLEILGAFGMSPKAHDATLSAGLKWEGRNDWMTVGHTPVRAYRLRARLFDRYQVIVVVSQVGEILRVELPDEWTLINDTLTSL